jgi:hypothetical protein
MKKIRVYMGIMSTGLREDIHTYLFRDLQERYGDRVEMVFPDQCVHRFPHDFSRNEYVNDFLASGCDVLWFLDSDVAPPKFIFDLLVSPSQEWLVAGAPYPLWMAAPGTQEPSILFTTYDGLVEDEAGVAQGIRMTECPQSGQRMVDALATGCMFIKREVFEKLEKPYFAFKHDEKTRRVIEGEDLGFCLKLNKLGIRCLIDYSMVCKHYKRIDLLDLNNYAISLSNKKVMEYDAEIRQQVEKAVHSAYRQGFKDGQSKVPPLPTKAHSGLILPKGY